MTLINQKLESYTEHPDGSWEATFSPLSPAENETDVLASVTVPANSLQVGDVIPILPPAENEPCG